MSPRNQFIKVRVSRGEHVDVQKRADAQGLTISEYVRNTVTTVHERLDVVAALEALRAQCSTQPTRSKAFDRGDNALSPEAATVEALLLLRELAAARDAQILSRVRAQLKQRGLVSQAGGGAA